MPPSLRRQTEEQRKEDKVVDIWTLIQSDLGSQQDTERNTDTYTLVVGSKDSGKSCLIQQFLGKEEGVKPTVALEYQFARRPRAGSGNNAKDISHIWELGGGSSSGGSSSSSSSSSSSPSPSTSPGNLRELVAVPLKHSVGSAVVVIVIDTNSPNNAVPALNRWLRDVRSTVDSECVKFRKEDAAGGKAMDGRASSRLPPDHPDRGLVDPCPVPLVIVASKFDALKAKDTSGRRALLQALRFLAHANGATLVTASTKDKGSRDLWRSVARAKMFQAPGAVKKEEGEKFSEKDGGGDKVEIEKEKNGGSSSSEAPPAKWRKARDISDGPFKIEAGSDTFDAILSSLPKGSVKSDFLSSSGAQSGSDRVWERSCEAFFGKPDEATEEKKDELEQDEKESEETSHPEPKVDEARDVARVRLNSYKKEVERREEIARAAAWDQSKKPGGKSKGESKSRRGEEGDDEEGGGSGTRRK